MIVPKYFYQQYFFQMTALDELAEGPALALPRYVRTPTKPSSLIDKSLYFFSFLKIFAKLKPK